MSHGETELAEVSHGETKPAEKVRHGETKPAEKVLHGGDGTSREGAPQGCRSQQRKCATGRRSLQRRCATWVTEPAEKVHHLALVVLRNGWQTGTAKAVFVLIRSARQGGDHA